jgi:hypothetical protein
MKDALAIQLTDGSRETFVGRAGWALCHLIRVGEVGLTTMDHPAPRWSHYIFLLRKAGLVITTEYERHSGDYPGTHGRYRLETRLSVVEWGDSEMQPTLRILTVTCGRGVLGTIEQKGQRRFMALLLSGETVGEFPSAAGAAQAINNKLQCSSTNSEGSVR